MKTAKASHILVATEQQCNELKQKIEQGTNFGDLAKQFSKCPSGRNGGALGTFKQGQMVAEFDSVVFSAELNKVHGPVKTGFGYHLIWIDERTE